MGDVGPVLDMMAVMLENLSSIVVMARTLISVVYRTARIAASIPNLSYENKARLTHFQNFLLLTKYYTTFPSFHLIFVHSFPKKFCRPFLRHCFINY